MPLLCPRDDWPSPGFPHAAGTRHVQPGQGPVEVSPIKGRPYKILANNADSLTAMSMLQELHMATCLRCLQVDPHDKSIKMFFCPFCTYTGANDLSYLNHIIIAHYNASYGCGKCLKQAFMSSSAFHNHKKVCLGFDKKFIAGSDSKPSSGGAGDGSQGSSSTRATPKKNTNSQGHRSA